MKRLSKIIETLTQRRAMWIVAALSLVTLAVAVYVNPAKLGTYIYTVSKLTLAAVLGYCVDLAASPGASPDRLDGIEASMAANRRVTLMAAAIIAAGLMP